MERIHRTRVARVNDNERAPRPKTILPNLWHPRLQRDDLCSSRSSNREASNRAHLPSPPAHTGRGLPPRYANG